MDPTADEIEAVNGTARNGVSTVDHREARNCAERSAPVVLASNSE